MRGKYLFLLVFSLNVLVTFVVSLFPVDSLREFVTIEKVEAMRDVVNVEGLGLPYIFGNNLMLTLPSFVPFAGLGWSLILAYNNGVAFSTFHFSYLMFLMPFFILEYLANSIAVVEGLRVVLALHSKSTLKEVTDRILRNIGFCSLILFFSAIIELVI